MEGMASSVLEIAFLIGILVVQYFLAKRPQKWMAFILPVCSVLISIKDVITIIQSETMIMGGVFGTSVIVFLSSSITTAMLLMVWWKKDYDIATIAIAALAVYILGSIALAMFMVAASFFWAVNV